MEAAERRALEYAADSYRNFPDVRAVSFGSKFTDGSRLEDVQAIQFFVTSKIPKDDLRKPLPRFIYGRRPDGSPDRDHKIPTDVIEMGDLELCCASGDSLDRVGAEGCVTLIFRNKTPDARLLAITCSHVAAELFSNSPPLQLTGGSENCLFQANVIANTALENGELEFDIAVAEVVGHDPDLTELAVADDQTILDGFVDEAVLATGNSLRCISRVTGDREITSESRPTFVSGIDAGHGTEIAIGNLIACKGDAVPGDSGGIVFVGTKAAGIVVARGKDGWVLIHSLEAAIAHLASAKGIALKCFS